MVVSAIVPFWPEGYIGRLGMVCSGAVRLSPRLMIRIGGVSNAETLVVSGIVARGGVDWAGDRFKGAAWVDALF
jgi:hypothetical protein